MMGILSKVSNNTLVAIMEEVREMCAVIHNIRNENNIRARQPLASATIIDPLNRYSYLCFDADIVDIIKDECNVKRVFYRNETQAFELMGSNQKGGRGK